jgi:OOP family OmpA-OmpF porin
MNIIKRALCAGILFPLALAAQNKEEKGLNNFNTWSVEVNAGMNNAIMPFGDGYSASNENKFFSPRINHFDLGLRYMITSKFGFKLDLANDKVANASGSSSLPFESQQNRLGLQAVINAGRLMGFDEFSKNIGLLIHAGIQASLLTPKTGVNKDITEKNGGILFGITPQVKLSNRLALTLDFTVISNTRQHFAWDGSNSAQSNNLNGQMYNTSVGLTYFLGSNETHADWITPIHPEQKVAEIAKRMEAVEQLMNDTDRDGVVDHLDAQNNTPTGVAVDSKGRFIDANNNGAPDEMEPNKGVAEVTTPESNAVNASNSDSNALKALVEKGFVNVFFDVNQQYPNPGSTNNVFQLIAYLRLYKDSKITLCGFADLRGDEKSNQDLSKRRAENVRKLIIDSGIDASRISIDPQGEDKNTPVSKTGYDLSRRVSIKIN